MGAANLINTDCHGRHGQALACLNLATMATVSIKRRPTRTSDLHDGSGHAKVKIANEGRGGSLCLG